MIDGSGCLVVAVAAGLLAAAAPQVARAQAIQLRLERAHNIQWAQAIEGPRYLKRDRALAESRWQAARPQRLAQVAAGPLGVPQGIPPTSTGPATTTDPETLPTPSPGTPATPPKPPRREIMTFVDTKLGFDRDKKVVNTPGALELDITRRIRAVSLTAGYPLTRDTALFIGVPYVYQSTEVRAPAAHQSLRQVGSGIGDISAVVERRFPEIAKGTELAVSAGMEFPTGKDPFHLAANELPTGLGFYQALVHATVRTLRVPLHFYTSVDFAHGFARNINGQRMRLPNSYGAEAGFYYTLGPEFTVGTALSWNRLSSPFLLGTGEHVAYLSQSLTYNTGKKSSLRGSFDIGLTPESTDAYLGLGYNTAF